MSFMEILGKCWLGNLKIIKDKTIKAPKVIQNHTNVVFGFKFSQNIPIQI